MFDFVHIRQLFGAIADWPALYVQAFRVVKPGGYFESFESSVDIKADDGSIQEGDILYKFVALPSIRHPVSAGMDGTTC